MQAPVRQRPSCMKGGRKVVALLLSSALARASANDAAAAGCGTAQKVELDFGKSCAGEGTPPSGSNNLHGTDPAQAIGNSYPGIAEINGQSIDLVMTLNEGSDLAAPGGTCKGTNFDIA